MFLSLSDMYQSFRNRGFSTLAPFGATVHPCESRQVIVAPSRKIQGRSYSIKVRAFGSVSRAPEFLGLRSCGFGGDSSRIGRSLGVTYAFTHKPELPQEQPRLKCGNEREDTSGGDKAQRIERNGIIRRPLPEGFEWLVLAAAAIGCVIASALAQTEGTGSRLSLARMASAGLVQTKGLGSSLCALR